MTSSGSTPEEAAYVAKVAHDIDRLLAAGNTHPRMREIQAEAFLRQGYDPAVVVEAFGLAVNEPREGTPEGQGCPFCPDGHRRPGSRPMAVWVGPERDKDGQPTTLHVTYAAGHHVSEAEAEWLRDLISGSTPEGQEPTCPHCGSHEVRATRGVLSITGPIAQALCACGKWYRLDDGGL